MKSAYFAGGCFWCISDVFSSIRGVIDVVSGYSGGNFENPTYDDVKSQTTGHRETVKVIYDEYIVSFWELLEIYFSNVDPFDIEGQFGDKGFSYTLAIFYSNDNEFNIINEFLLERQQSLDRKICISIEPLVNFYQAEDYHQNYSKKHPQEFEEELISSGRKKR